MSSIKRLRFLAQRRSTADWGHSEYANVYLTVIANSHRAAASDPIVTLPWSSQTGPKDPRLEYE